MLHRLEYFIVVAEELSLRQAARRLGLTQPNITNQILRLEQELGFDLLVRDQQRVLALTSAGMAFLGEARRLVAELNNANCAARAIAAGKSRVVRIGLCEEVVGNLSRFVQDCQRDLPDCGLEFFEFPICDLARAVVQGEIDIGLDIGTATLPGADIHPLWQDSWYAVMRTDHSLADQQSLTCMQLADEPLIIGHERERAGAHFLVIQAFREAGVHPVVSVRFLRRSAMLTLVGAGLGISFVPENVAHLQLPGLTAVPFAIPAMQVSALVRNGFSGTRDADVLQRLQQSWERPHL